MITLYAHAGRLELAPFPDADHIRVAVPTGSEVLPVRGEPLLFVPSGRMTRHAWTARDIFIAARDGVKGFDLIERIPARHARQRTLAGRQPHEPSAITISTRKRLERLRDAAEWFLEKKRAKATV